MLESGVHATLAGVIIGLSIPLTRRDGTPFLDGTERTLKPHVKFMILPLFAFANAGLPLADLLPARALEPVPLGIAAGLPLGKPIGVLAACWIAARFRLASLRKGCNWAHILGVGLLAGIGFTTSLFIGSLAFVTEEHVTAVRVGVIYGGACGRNIWLADLRFCRRRHSPPRFADSEGRTAVRSVAC